MKRFYILIFCLAMLPLANVSYSQDIHFSQFPNAMVLYNPAFNGQFEQMMKGTLLHRRQWRGIGEGFTTSGFDAQYKLLSLYADTYLGFGLLVLQDNAGYASLKTFSVKGSVAYHMVTGSNDMLSAGATIGYEQRSMNFDGLTWDSQYNGVNYDPTLDDKERIIAERRGVVDVGAGINWRHKGKNKVSLGYGIFHANQQRTMVARGDDRLRVRSAFNASLVKRYKYIDMKYDALVQRQSGAMEIMLGITTDYRLGDDSRYTNVKTSSIIRVGVFYRNRDAIHPYVGFDYKRFAGISIGYDVRMRRMPAISSRPGGIELTISYLGLPNRRRMKVVY
jgi:type IX secretion system PorP/SprF family membrane protein